VTARQHRVEDHRQIGLTQTQFFHDFGNCFGVGAIADDADLDCGNVDLVQ